MKEQLYSYAIKKMNNALNCLGNNFIGDKSWYELEMKFAKLAIASIGGYEMVILAEYWSGLKRKEAQKIRELNRKHRMQLLALAIIGIFPFLLPAKRIIDWRNFNG